MNITQFLESMSLAIVAGLCAVSWRQILAHKLPFINKFFKWGSKYEARWFYKPIWGCMECFAGQFALWIYLATHFRVVIYTKYELGWHFISKVALLHTSLQYSIVGHISAICGAMVLTTIFNNQYLKAENGA